MAWEAAIFDSDLERRDAEPVVSDELGTKRTCPSCAARFYDLNKDPIECPKCEATFVAEPLLPSKADQPAPKPKAEPKPSEKDDEDDAEENDNLVSLEDLDTDTDDADDETAGIEDVDLGDDDADSDDEDDSNVFLDEDEDEGGTGVEDLIGGAGAKPGDDEG